MYPAAQGNWLNVLWVTLTYGVITILTMIGICLITTLGFMRVKLDFMEKYVHALTGIIIAISGLTIKIFGL
jgi:hypothetical protein